MGKRFSTKVKERVRADMLRRRGVKTNPHGHVVANPVDHRDPSPMTGVPSEGKTLRMRVIELELGIPIEEILLAGNLEEVAEVCNVDFTTVSKWRKMLGLR